MNIIAALIEKMAEAAYNKFNENQIGCCELSWAEMPQDFKDRMIEAQQAAVEVLKDPEWWKLKETK